MTLLGRPGTDLPDGGRTLRRGCARPDGVAKWLPYYSKAPAERKLGRRWVARQSPKGR